MIDGKILKLEEGEKVYIENIVYMKDALDRLFGRLTREISDQIKKENHMWNKYETVTKEQYPEYNREKYFISWDKVSRTMSIKLNKDFGRTPK